MPEAKESLPYRVLARKYRPVDFTTLVGQEAMVRTLRNAFATGRIAHAFMLTGVRGVGKTTTARLLARALNYESDTVHEPTLDLSVEGIHCASRETPVSRMTSVMTSNWSLPRGSTSWWSSSSSSRTRSTRVR